MAVAMQTSLSERKHGCCVLTGCESLPQQTIEAMWRADCITSLRDRVKVNRPDRHHLDH